MIIIIDTELLKQMLQQQIDTIAAKTPKYTPYLDKLAIDALTHQLTLLVGLETGLYEAAAREIPSNDHTT